MVDYVVRRRIRPPVDAVVVHQVGGQHGQVIHQHLGTEPGAEETNRKLFQIFNISSKAEIEAGGR